MPVARTWHDAPVEQVMARLRTRPSGLDTDEALSRLVRFGPNVLPRESARGPLELLWRQVASPLPMVLLASGLLALAFGRFVDGTVVVAVVAVNAFIGALQEFKAGRAIEALSALVPEYVTALRDGLPTSIPAGQLVPGDVVLVEAGNRIPADMRLSSVRHLSVDEAAVTGESVPTAKQVDPVPPAAALGDRSSMLFSGTMVAAGTASAVVVATGTATELGRISALLREVQEVETPLTRSLGRFGTVLTVAIGIVAYFILLVALRRGYPFVTAVRSAVSLVVAAVPSSLPAITTVALAVAVRRMARRNAIIRSLPSIETLGSTTVICSDKTGTLTRGEMVVRALWTPSGTYRLSGEGYVPTGDLLLEGRRVEPPFPRDVLDLVHAAALCSDADVRLEGGSWKPVGDPTEVALVVAAAKLGVRVRDECAAAPRLDVIPFDPATRHMATLHARPGRSPLIVVKGAPEVVLAMARGADRPGWTIDPILVVDAVQELALLGMRVLAVAVRSAAPHTTHLEPSDLSGLRLLGLLASMDPPRSEAIAAVRAMHQAGVVVKMATGDHPGTARVIGMEIGITGPDSRVVTGDEMSRLSSRELGRIAASVNVFSRVAPEHKLRLVEALQARGHVVAMTGDGVNDAPALKQADVGVAMGRTGTAAAKEASDVVLVDDNFASIAAAIEGGRRCYDNLVKAIMFVVPTNLGQSFVLLVGVLAFPIVGGQPLLPIVPLQILWVNLVTGVTLAIPLAFEAPEPDLMLRRPRARDEPIFTPQLAMRCLVVSFVMSAGAIGLFLHHGGVPGNVAGPDVALRQAQTMVATTIVLAQVFYLLQCRSLRTSFFSMDPFSNPAIYAGIAATIGMQAAFVHARPMNVVFHSAPLGARDWLVSALVAAMVLPVTALEKWLHARRGDRAA
jgi:Ca2+-transporting ATPase